LLKIDARGKRVLIISDLHIPYSIAGYYSFLKWILETKKPDIIINIGDEVDYHAQSMHDHNPDLDSAGKELDKSIIELQEGIHKLFPKMYLLESNHGSMIGRRASKSGIPVRAIRDLPDLYETPGWSWHEEILLLTSSGPVYLCHGKSGAYGKLAQATGTSAIQGHFHGKFEITYHRGPLGCRYNMFVGCLADQSSLAMAYGKNFTQKFINGVGFIKASGEPLLIPFRKIDNKSGNQSEPPPIPKQP
jgi:hypothetical protein